MSENKECCPKFDPKLWDEKTIEWNDKQFIKGKVLTFMFMPLNFGSVMTKLTKLVDKGGAKFEDGLCLSDSKSMWSMDLYLAVDKEVAGAENTTLSGKYIAKVYEGEFKDTGIWMKSFEKYVKEKGYKSKKTYMWYTTCPKCAIKYGHNYVVLFAEI
jgi:hypothetical protein